MPPAQQNALEERSPEVEATALEEGSAKTCEQNSKETELKDRNGSVERSESEGNSEARSSRKRQVSPRDSSLDGAGPSSKDERTEAPHGEEGKVPEAGNSRDSSDSEGTRDSHRRRPQRRRHAGRSKRPRSPGDQPPPLRKSLVTSLRSVSEAIYQDVVQMQRQQVQAPLAWEHLAVLAQLRAPLNALVHSVYAMASQAAYAIPAEGWLAPSPQPGTLGQRRMEDKAKVSPGRERSPPPPQDRRS
ncbi:protein FRG2-like-1 [Talpa occidentalis]|uniref:protein FRG2-like-1 n=1 Tax=Talpa occidentalis TaxID=50954 RepID=UPI00188E78C9|nr:protein FRG2-like-1 [Talpa occidentalis]